MANFEESMLTEERFEDAPPPAASRNASAYSPLQEFVLPPYGDRVYSLQFADMYFLRLMQMKKTVKERAAEEWRDVEIGGQKATFVERVQDVRQGELSWVVGTIFMVMPGKQNVLDDAEHDHWIADPLPRHTYVSSSGHDQMVLEDESGRLHIAGLPLHRHYVTGCILAALGTEEADGTFRIVATHTAGLPRQPLRWERDEITLSRQKQIAPQRERAGKLAIVSGLNLGAEDGNELWLDLLVEYLTGEASTQDESSKITRLVIAGGSLARGSPILPRDEFEAQKLSAEDENADEPTWYEPEPMACLDEFLCDILPTLPITMLPGARDPTNVALPQQPIHPTLLPNTKFYAEPLRESKESLNGFDAVTNPWVGDIDGYRVLGTGGQTVTDLLKYIKHGKSVDAMENMLQWRCVAPTAPDTLWCYPFQDKDPLMLTECPHIYFAGCQKKFDKKIIEGPAGQKVLLVSVPKFRLSCEIVLVDMESWDVEVVKLGAGKAGKEKRAKVRAEEGKELA